VARVVKRSVSSIANADNNHTIWFSAEWTCGPEMVTARQCGLTKSAFAGVVYKWPVLISYPAAGKRLSRPGWLVTFHDGIPSNGHPLQY